MMDEKITHYTIKLADGTEFTGLIGCGTGNFWSSEGFGGALGRKINPGYLHEVTITSDDAEEVNDILGYHESIQVLGIFPERSGGEMLSLKVPSEEELRANKLAGDVAYIAMMTGVELDD